MLRVGQVDESEMDEVDVRLITLSDDWLEREHRER